MLPFDWSIRFGYYFTYFGDVYHGIAVQLNSMEDDFFIISRNQYIEFNKLQQNQKTREEFLKLGIYIRNQKVMQNWIEGDGSEFGNNHGGAVGWTGRRDNDFKTMYVFGAGASTFCQFGKGADILKKDTLRPPLGIDLLADRFDAVIHKYAGLKQSLPKFEAFNNDVEAILENDWQELIAGFYPRLAAQHTQLQFYLREIFEQISNHVCLNHFRYNLYALFLQRVFSSHSEGRRPVFVSFNYDTVFDTELEKHFGLQFKNMGNYISQNQNEDNPFLYFKPHGSWNWGWKFREDKIKSIPPGKLEDWLYQNQITPATIYYELLGGTEMLNGWGHEMQNNEHRIGKLVANKDLISVAQKGKPYYPALLLPYRDKDEFVMPYTHHTMLESAMRHVEELVLIGWKGNEKLFNRKLKQYANGLKKITIVNPDAKNVKTELSKYFDLTKYEVEVVDGFENYVLNHVGKSKAAV